jgi:DNA-3-methyladenine glycosylase
MAGSVTRLRRAAFARPTIRVARALLGCVIYHRVGGDVLRGRIVEVEAYTDDAASHAAHGRRTPRSAIMFGVPGVAYVYQAYGVHCCLNVTTEAAGRPGAVLIRGVDGIDHACGPGLVCRALRLSLRDNGRDMTTDPDLWIEGAARQPRSERVVRTTRIGISRAADLPHRLYLFGSPGVSRRDRQAEARGGSRGRPA